MGAGFHGLNGIGPEVASLVYRTYVLPTLTYGLQALVLSDKEKEVLSAYHRKNIRYLQHLPQSTATPALYLLMGILPVEALVDIQILTFFRNIASPDENSPPAVFVRDMLVRQLAMKDCTSSSWAMQLRSTLHRYQLPPAHVILQNTPTKAAWKRQVKAAVHDTWTRKLRSEASDKSSLQLLNVESCTTDQMHPVWQDLGNPLAIRKATVKAQLLVQRYPLTTSPTAGKRRLSSCPLCCVEPETTIHFLLLCPKLREARLPYLRRIMDTCRKHEISVDTDSLVKMILDTSFLPEPSATHEDICRNFVYIMHNTRAIMLGGGVRIPAGTIRKCQTNCKMSIILVWANVV
jgi:hypothetical protein